MTAVLAVSVQFVELGRVNLVKCIYLVDGPVAFGDELEDSDGEWWIVVETLGPVGVCP